MTKIYSNNDTPRIDMTPMVDLGFLLIISFMISSYLAKPNMMKLNMPSNRSSGHEVIGCFLHNPFLHLVLGKDNRVFWYDNEAKLNSENFKEISYGLALRKLILQRRKEAPDEYRFKVIVYATDASNYKNLVDALDEMTITKQDRYVLADIPSNVQQVYEDKLKF
ncbi:biopolymer transporter ExbD [Emticicia sp. BO119]|uniref:ExbD/TolR family protein n=1 Tax=Emticicia sp. BO119 TaxID=2757768 RepID=UPI0015F0B5B4|nr:biopolymer transporter ExbD [Emticicia sp. BO119]MBA4849886.1 biopolymer transporter ExbD [Emticicia sp. BO119]